MKESQLADYEIDNSSSGPWAPDYSARIQYCRSKIRELEHLKFDNNCNLSNVHGDRLHSDTVTLIEKCLELKKEYISNIVANDNFVSAPTPTSNFTTFLNKNKIK